MQLVPVVIAIAALNFILLSLAPGDAAEILSASDGGGSASDVAALRHSLGLDQPLYLRFLHYMVRLFTLHLGQSQMRDMPVATLIWQRIPPTLLLMFVALTIAVVIGVSLGIVAAMNHGRLLDHGLSFVSLLLYATPQFWLGLMLIIVFSVHFRWFPSGGMYSIGTSETGLAFALDVTHHLVLPALTLAVFYLAIYFRLMRSSMLEVLNQDYITAARARGVGEVELGASHAARNAFLPVITFAGVQLGNALGGQILIETVFGWPGLGRLVMDALLSRDLPVLLGVLFISSVMVVAMNLIVDILYGVLDPRISNC